MKVNGRTDFPTGRENLYMTMDPCMKDALNKVSLSVNKLFTYTIPELFIEDRSNLTRQMVWDSYQQVNSISKVNG
jgi:hypothetical protein